MKNYLVLIVLLQFILLNGAIAEDQKSEEAQKRKIVSRIYQMTDGSLARCPTDNIKDFKASLHLFKSTYPELIKLVNDSEYYQDAVRFFLTDIERSKKESKALLLRESM